MSRKIKVGIIVTTDILLIFSANILSYIFVVPYARLPLEFVSLAIFTQMFFYVLFGLGFNVFTRINRYTSLREIISIFFVTICSSSAEFLSFYLFIDNISKRYIILTFLFTLFFISASRIVWRIFIEVYGKNFGKELTAKRALIVGAGDGGDMLLKSLHNSEKSNKLQIIGIVDDDSNKKNTLLYGFKVLGNTNDIEKIVNEKNIEIIIIAIPSLKPKELARIVDIITPLGLPVNTIPSIEELASGNVNISRLREIDVVDLLGREEVKLDMTSISEQLKNMTVLVTGAGGSIGSEICRQVIQFHPKKVILLGHGENSIYLIHKELLKYVNEVDIVPLIADVQDRERIFTVIKNYRPDIIYHAAAHKHVPLMEFNPREAVKNNIYGTKNVAEAAKEFSVETFVMISTDKAVNPPNVMGATKRIAEMIVTELNEAGKTKFCVVRFGNVLGSRGSVIPVFEEQISDGGPVTITDFRMTRYFMTIPEASRLVIQAAALAHGGEVFILDMGEPVKIYDLAKNMIKLSGYKENEIEIIETGIRPGEKLYEELLVSKEKNPKQVFEKIFIGNVNGFTKQEVQSFLEGLPISNEQLSKILVKFANDSSK